MSLLSASGGGTSASGNDAASPPVTPAEGRPPPLLLAALSRLRVEGAGAAAAFDRVLAAEASPTWRGLALLGRGLCEELHGARLRRRRVSGWRWSSGRSPTRAPARWPWPRSAALSSPVRRRTWRRLPGVGRAPFRREPPGGAGCGPARARLRGGGERRGQDRGGSLAGGLRAGRPSHPGRRRREPRASGRRPRGRRRCGEDVRARDGGAGGPPRPGRRRRAGHPGVAGGRGGALGGRGGLPPSGDAAPRRGLDDARSGRDPS